MYCVCKRLPKGVPHFLTRDEGTGWGTAEYGMLTKSNHRRMDREALQKGETHGRTQEKSTN